MSEVSTEKLVAVALGIAAWAAVAGIAVLVNSWGDDSQVLAFLPIAASLG